jgi:hypothetical protein
MSTNVPSPTQTPTRQAQRRRFTLGTPLVIVVAVGVVCFVLVFVVLPALFTWSFQFNVGGPPYELSFGRPTATVPATGLSWIALPVSPTPGIETSYFTLELDPPVGTSVPSGEAPTTCAALSLLTVTACGVPVQGEWYAVLITDSTKSILNVYATGNWSGGPVILNLTMSLTVVSNLTSSLSGTGDTLSVHGAGGVSVIGSSYPL